MFCFFGGGGGKDGKISKESWRFHEISTFVHVSLPEGICNTSSYFLHHIFGGGVDQLILSHI